MEVSQSMVTGMSAASWISSGDTEMSVMVGVEDPMEEKIPTIAVTTRERRGWRAREERFGLYSYSDALYSYPQPLSLVKRMI